VIPKKFPAMVLTAAMVLLVSACLQRKVEKPPEEIIAEAAEGDAAALRSLIGMFSHPDPEVSQKAWEGVVDMGAAAEGELIGALESKDLTVAEHAAGALGSMASKPAVEPLVKALRGWKTRQYVVAWALGEIGDPGAIPVLVEAMGAEDAEVRKYAARSVIKFGHEAVDVLLDALESESEEVRHYAVRALGEIRDPRSVEPLLAAGGKVDREVHLWALGRLGDPRGYVIIAASAGDPDRKVRLTAIQAIMDLGDPRAVPVLQEALGDEEWMVREWAARGLESITGQRYRYRSQNGEEVYPYALYR